MKPEDHWCLLAAAPVGRVELPRWIAQARSLIHAELTLLQRLGDPDGALPAVASLGFTLRPIGDAAEPTVVQVHTLPLTEAPAVKAAAERAAEAIGGAGMDALVARATRAWLVAKAPSPGGDARAPLAMAALLAGLLLAPVVPPEGGVIFGLKGARLRLEALGWRT
ncbi:MAG: hypothetical protein Q8S73_27275 [Deltaproteobacteria bacterium]|nr:hypothetical protein [Myxococcales bacterium]MDP3217839.1 hypothetical protein [Deltaproteobacteria bacterium]